MRSVNMLKAAVGFVAIALVFVVAVPSAQAVGVYNRVLSNVGLNDCLFTNDFADPRVNVGYCDDMRTRLWVHVKNDSYRGTGHEVWQFESAIWPGRCVIAGNFSGAELTLGSCQYSGNVHNKFEVFKSVRPGGNNIYQLKDIEAFENNGQHRCLARNTTYVPFMGSCNLSNAVHSSYWDAISW
jgi:hypothetical protein